MEWFIKIQRKILEWEWYDDINTKVLFLHLLFTCNFKQWKWRGKIISPWQIITSLPHLAEETKLSVQQVRTAIQKLKSTWEITHESTDSYTMLTLNNWDIYNTQDNRQVTDEQQTSNRQVTAIEEYNNGRKKERYRAFAHLSLSQEEFERLIAEWYSKEQIDSKLDEIENFKGNKKYTSLNLTIRKWIKRDEDKNKYSEWMEVLKRMQREWYDINLMNSYLKLTEKKLIERFMKDKEWVNREFKDKKLEIIEKYGIQIDWVELHNLK